MFIPREILNNLLFKVKLWFKKIFQELMTQWSWMMKTEKFYWLTHLPRNMLKCDTEIITSVLWTTNKLVEDVSSNDDKSEDVILPYFKEILNRVETLREYFICHSV